MDWRAIIAITRHLIIRIRRILVIEEPYAVGAVTERYMFFGDQKANNPFDLD